MEMCLIERLDISIEKGEKKSRDTVVITVSFNFEKMREKMHDLFQLPEARKEKEEREIHEKMREIKYESISRNIQMMNIL